MKTLTLLALVLALSAPATREAQFQWFVDDGSPPMRDLVRMSDLIVIGKLHSVREWDEEKVACGRGIIDIRDVIWGDSASGDTLALEWRDHAVPFMHRPRGDLSQFANRDHVWLLAGTGISSARAVSPGCAYRASANVRAWVERELAAAPAMIWIGSGWYPKGAVVPVTLGYRNFSDEVREFPGLVFSDSVLHVDPRVSVVFKETPWFLVHARAGHLVSDDSVPPLRVEPMSELGVTFDMGAVFPLTGRNFLLTYEVAGYGKEWTRSLHLR